MWEDFAALTNKSNYEPFDTNFPDAEWISVAAPTGLNGDASYGVYTGRGQICSVAIGNEEDAEKVFGIKAPEADVSAGKLEAGQYQFVCEELRKKFPGLHTISITLRGSLSASHSTWLGVLWQNGSFYAATTYNILPIVDRVGGDAFMGGLIYGLRNYADDPQKALNFAAATACLKHSVTGDFNLVSVSEVEKLMAGDASGRVSR